MCIFTNTIFNSCLCSLNKYLKVLTFSFCNSLETCSSYLTNNPTVDREKFTTQISVDLTLKTGLNYIEFGQYFENYIVPRNSCITWSTQNTAAIEAEKIQNSSPPDYKLSRPGSSYNFQKIQVNNMNARYFLSAAYKRCLTRLEYNSSNYVYAVSGLFTVTVTMNKSNMTEILQLKVNDCKLFLNCFQPSFSALIL